ncbi:MAG: flagellar motor stator protein MotA [Micavibrio aeruginosavorus]|uniref:Flagellar motor stator protein MotA n=1 Tax=Micavibrio aeruginosavorus TaxID=349221 RepID=A0A2W5FFF0_9BACT|nr:MAG: flagellar motor stator protein MotA [Micavibrio aeruginosavorus]
MKFLGLALIFVFTFGGLIIAMHFDFHHFMGVLMVILKALPGEFTIIFGCAVAAFLTSNSMPVVKETLGYFRCLSKPAAYSKEDYMELLSFMFATFKLIRSKGWLAIEAHIENPHDSALFNAYPTVAHNHHAVTFVSDYLRIISLGNENPMIIESLMDLEIETIQEHHAHPGHAMQTMADGIPALGIVAAVLGVIKTMASITEPPEVLGAMIGGALVGTFLGVWLAYGMVGPIAGAMNSRAATEVMYYKCIRVGILSFLQGAAPQVAVEFARKFLPHEIQPTFQELEEKLNSVTPPT